MAPNHAGGVSGRTALPRWQRAVLFSLAYFVCAEVGSYLSARSGNYVSFWLPAGLFVAVFLLNPTRDWPVLVLAALPANVVFDFLHDARPNIAAVLLFYFANVVQTVLGAWLVRRFVEAKPALASLKEFVGLIIFSGVLSTALGAAIGAATLTGFGMSRSFGQSWEVWWGSCAMAVLVFAPFVLAWCSRPAVKLHYLGSAKKKLELAALFLGLTAFLVYLLTWDKGIMSNNRALAIPFLLWAGLRFGPRIGSAVSLLLAFVVAFFTTRYLVGLSAGQITTGSYVFSLQVYLAMSNLVVLIPAIVLGERDQTMARLRDSENHFRSLTEAAFEGICISENGIILDMNDQGLKMFGYERAEMIGKEIIAVVAAESRPMVAQAIRSGQEAVIGHQLIRRDGTFFYAEAQARTVRVGGRTLRMTALRDITERKQAEQALRESEEKFSKAFRSSPDGICLSELETGRFLEVNEGFCRLYQHSREDLIGRTPVELGIFENTEARSRFVNALKAQGAIREMEFTTRRRDGQKRLIQASAERMELGDQQCIVTVVHDITERRQAEDALRESEEKFSKAFRTSPDVMSIVDLETGRYLEVNDAHEKIFGFKREEVIGRSPLELGIIENPAHREKMLELLARTGSVRGLEIEALNRSGEKLTLLHSAELIELGGQKCVLRVSHDITGRKRAEAERQQALEREQAARIQYTFQIIAAQEAERKRIAAELHDSLGQNLLLIKNRAQLALTRGRSPAECVEQLESISGLATVCIAEARQISHDLHPQQLDHLGLTRALEALVKNTSQASNIRFTAKFEPVDEFFPPAAAINLYRIVQESLNNILKHSRARHVEISLERDIHEVQLWIEDDGSGFKPEPAGGGGTGLGLKNIAERVRMLGGNWTVDSAPGHGTRIEVTIPVAAEPA